MKLNNLTISSGVYVMKDSGGAVIYVGKAKNLKNRVSQYFNPSIKLPKVQSMVEHIDDFDYYITLSEQDAFALENNLIKKYQPFYNILLKDSKTFAYIKLNTNDEYPYFEVTRKLKKDGKYFGPYITGVSAYDVLNILNMAYPIRKCKGRLKVGRKRPCLYNSLGICDAPCMGNNSKAKYLQTLQGAIEFLKGNDNKTEEILTQKMKSYAELENFEKALEMRDYLKIVQKLKDRVVANIPKCISFDAFAYVSDGQRGAVCVLTIRNGKILGIEDFSVNDGSLSEIETLQEFILAYYDNKKLPQEVLTNLQIGDENFLNYLTFLKNTTVKIVCPKISIKKDVVKMAEENAREHLYKRVSEDKLKFKRTLGALIGLKDTLLLNGIPKRIECYDVSHIGGTNTVASMVVFENGEASKKQYRKFKIKSFEGIDDFASLKEVLQRRVNEYIKAEDESFSKKPNLIVIDGGKGQIAGALDVLKNSELKDVMIIGIAKKYEELFLVDKKDPVILKRSSEELKLLERIRDEAHKFAITFHRSLRTKNEFKDPLENISGIGKVKIRELYLQFKTIENIKKASVKELQLVKTINKNNAQDIFNYLHKGEQ